MADEAAAPLRVGDMLYGFCAGHFGRDGYDDKRVEAIGSDWVVTRSPDPTHSAEVLLAHPVDPDALAAFRTPPPEEP